MYQEKSKNIYHFKMEAIYLSPFRNICKSPFRKNLAMEFCSKVENKRTWKQNIWQIWKKPIHVLESCKTVKHTRVDLKLVDVWHRLKNTHSWISLWGHFFFLNIVNVFKGHIRNLKKLVWFSRRVQRKPPLAPRLLAFWSDWRKTVKGVATTPWFDKTRVNILVIA